MESLLRVFSPEVLVELERPVQTYDRRNAEIISGIDARLVRDRSIRPTPASSSTTSLSGEIVPILRSCRRRGGETSESGPGDRGKKLADALIWQLDWGDKIAGIVAAASAAGAPLATLPCVASDGGRQHPAAIAAGRQRWHHHPDHLDELCRA
jgi:hypothetical protein